MIGDRSKATIREQKRIGKIINRPKEIYPYENYETKQLSIIAKANNYNDRKIDVNKLNYIDNRPFGYYTTIVEYNNSLSFDMSEAASNEILLKGDLFIENILNISNGSEYIFTFKQDEVGNHSVVINSGNVNLYISNNKSLEDINKQPNSTTVLKITCIDDKLFGELSSYEEDETSGYTKIINNSFSFNIEIANSGDTFTLPINTTDDADQYIQDFTVDWGDDSTTDITSFDDSGATHTYDAPGTYTITMTGKSELFAVGNGTDKNKIVKLNNFFGDIGFKKLNFYGCSNLTGNIPTSFKNLRNLVDVSRLFGECRNISGNIPEDMFWNSPNIVNMFQLFYRCINLTSEIPEKLFWYNPKVTDFSGVFYSSGVSGEIPEKLFWYNPEVINFLGSLGRFSGYPDNITGSIPEKLFWNNPKVEDFSYCFYLRSNITGSIPEKLFWNNPEVTSFFGTFSLCDNLTGSIPENLFWYNPKVTTFELCFIECVNLTGNIPEKLFWNNPEVTTFTQTFGVLSNSNSINNRIMKFSGQIPEKLFWNNPKLIDVGACFQNCRYLNGDIPSNLFINNRLINNYRELFNQCNQLTGDGWRDIIEYATQYAEENNINLQTNDCFKGCTSLTDYDDIPDEWK